MKFNKIIYLVLLVILIFSELTIYLIFSLINHNESIVLMKRDDDVFGTIGKSFLWGYKNAFLDRPNLSFMDGQVGSPTIMLPLGYLVYLLPFPINMILTRIVVGFVAILSLIYFYRSIFNERITRLSILLTYLIPSVAIFVTFVLSNISLLITNKFLIYSVTRPIIIGISQYGGIATTCGLFSLGALIRSKKIKTIHVLLLATCSFAHPVIGTIYLISYLTLVFYWRLSDIYKLFCISLGYLPWFFIMRTIAEEYMLGNNLYSIRSTITSISLLILRLSLYLAIVLYLWYKSPKKIESWKWVLFFLFFGLSLVPETKFSLIRNSYLFFPLTIFTVVVIVTGYFKTESKFKTYLLYIIFCIGLINLIFGFIISYNATIKLDNSMLEVLYKLKEYPQNAVMAPSNISYMIAGISEKRSLLGECCGLEKQKNIDFYNNVVVGNASTSFDRLNEIKYLVALCSATPNLGFRQVYHSQDYKYCLWER